MIYRLATTHSWPTDDRPSFSEAKSTAVARIADRTGCQWFWPFPRYGRLELKTFLKKLRPNRCKWRYGYYWQPIKCRQRPIRWHHRRPSTIYRLATMHPWWTDDIRTTDDNHANSSTVAQVRSAKTRITTPGGCLSVSRITDPTPITLSVKLVSVPPTLFKMSSCLVNRRCRQLSFSVFWHSCYSCQLFSRRRCR